MPAISIDFLYFTNHWEISGISNSELHSPKIPPILIRLFVLNLEMFGKYLSYGIIFHSFVV